MASLQKRLVNRRADPFRDDNYNTLFNELYTPLCRFAMKFVTNKDVAEDIVQDLFVYLWENWERLSGSPAIKSYAYTAIKNRALNYLKKEFLKERAEDPLELLSDNQEHKLPNPQELIENKELEAIIERALESLPAKCRTVFTLKRFGDLNNKEVAEQLNISIKTVENQMTIALRKLTAFINEHWGLAILIAVNHLILFF